MRRPGDLIGPADVGSVHRAPHPRGGRALRLPREVLPARVDERDDPARRRLPRLLGRGDSTSTAARVTNLPLIEEPKLWSLDTIFAVTSTVSAAPNRRKIVVPSVAHACATPPTISVVTQVTAP